MSRYIGNNTSDVLSDHCICIPEVTETDARADGRVRKKEQPQKTREESRKERRRRLSFICML